MRPGTLFEDLDADIDRQLIAGVDQLGFLAAALTTGVIQRFDDQRFILRQRGGFQDQRRVGGGVLGFELADGFDIAAVGDHRGQLLECV